MGRRRGGGKTGGHPNQEAAMPDAPFPRRRFLAGLATLPAWAHARPAGPMPAVLLAQEAPADVDPTGYLVSEKFDGVRALWDGRQLRFRSGLPLAAPAWFTQRLPAVALDGELWMGRGTFEALSGAVRRSQPADAEWRAIRYMVFEQPGGAGRFADRVARLEGIVGDAGFAPLQCVAQTAVPDRAALQRRLAEVLSAGGEGLVLHRADAPWLTGRSAVLLKLKPRHDAEAVVLMHLPGKGRHEGRLGALRVRDDDGRVFDLGTGFTDAQREEPPAIGSVVTYTHRGRTEAGLPRFASFLRERAPQ
jgi:DNA ligase 1